MDTKKEIKAGIIVLGLFIFTFSLFGLLNHYTDIKHFAITFGIIVILNIIGTILRIFSNHIIRIISIILTFPNLLFYALLRLVSPVLEIVVFVVLFWLIATFPSLVLILINRYSSLVNISDESLHFITLTSGSIIAIVFYRSIKNLTYRFYISDINSSKIEQVKLKGWIEYLFTPVNIRLFIYSIYFIYIFIFSIQYLEGNDLYTKRSIPTATLQAFLVFLAFDSLSTNSSQIKILPTELLKKLKEIFLTDFNEDNEENKKDANKK